MNMNNWNEHELILLIWISVLLTWIWMNSSELNWTWISSVQSIIHVSLFATPCTAALQVSLSITNSWSLPKLMSIESVMPSNHLIFCRPLSQIQGLFKGVSVSHQMAKLLHFQLEHQSFHWTSRLISFRMNSLHLLAVQGTLKNLLQDHSSKASILLSSAFFIVQLSHLNMTTGKTIA